MVCGKIWNEGMGGGESNGTAPFTKTNKQKKTEHGQMREWNARGGNGKHFKPENPSACPASTPDTTMGPAQGPGDERRRRKKSWEWTERE